VACKVVAALTAAVELLMAIVATTITLPAVTLSTMSCSVTPDAAIMLAKLVLKAVRSKDATEPLHVYSAVTNACC